MNIGFDASRAFTDNKTGTENYSFQILSHLLKLDHKNRYYIYTRPVGAGLVPALPWKGHPQGVPLHIQIPYPKLWTQAGLAMQTFKDPLDVLFVPAHTLPLIRRPGLKTVVTVHDLGAEFLPQTHQLKQRVYLNLMTHYQLKSATHIIAVSKATKQDLIKKVGIPKEKITVIYEGYNQDLFKPIRGKQLHQTLSNYQLLTTNYLLFVGTIQPRKNLERLIKAYASVWKLGKGKEAGMGKEVGQGVSHPNILTSSPNWPPNPNPTSIPQLVIAGSRGWLSDDIYKLPKKLGIEEHVKFLGYVPDKDLPALYSGATGFLFPSLFEGFGLPILEAMACGCPVLTSNTSSLPEVSGKAALLVDPYSENEISKGIDQLINNPALRKELSGKGFEQVKKFSWEKAAEETLTVLKKTLL